MKIEKIANSFRINQNPKIIRIQPLHPREGLTITRLGAFNLTLSVGFPKLYLLEKGWRPGFL